MKRLLWTAGMFLCSGIPGLAQGGGFGGGPATDDHDDTAPVQVGYAVVTPSTTVVGLSVRETFGLKDETETNQATFIAPELITSATMFVDVAERLGRNLAVAIANPGIFKQNGSPLTARMNGTSASSFINLVVPAGGALVLSPRDVNGDDRF